MSEQTVLVQLGDTLKRAKDLVGQLVKERMSREDYAGARSVLEWAQSIDSISSRLNPNSNGLPARPTLNVSQRGGTVTPTRLPYYHREPDRLVKVGKSVEGDGTYKHDVPKENFDEMISALMSIAKNSVRFDTKQFQSQVDRIPRHQSLIVLAVLEEQGVVKNTRRGQWTFADRTGFPLAAATAWENIPQR
jgi:hypothetical protein